MLKIAICDDEDSQRKEIASGNIKSLFKKNF